MSNNDYYAKYLKYKNKYLELKSLYGGKVTDCPIAKFSKNVPNFYTDSFNYDEVECILNQMIPKLESSVAQTFTLPEITTYLRALQGYYNKYVLCAPDATNQIKNQCKAHLAKLKQWRVEMQKKWKDVPGVNSLQTLIARESPSFAEATK
jgi:hypothetical protein